MGKIKLTQDYEALVDDTDFERVSEHKWYAKVERRADGSVRVYAVRNVPLGHLSTVSLWMRLPTCRWTT